MTPARSWRGASSLSWGKAWPTLPNGLAWIGKGSCRYIPSAGDQSH